MKAKYTCTVGQAKKIVLAIWVASLILAVPILFVQVHMRVRVKIPAYWCFRDIEKVQLLRLYEVYMLSLVLILPTCVMGGVYANISLEIWKVMRRRYHMTGGMKGINPPVDDQLGCNGSPTEKRTTMASKSMRLSSKKRTSVRRFQKPRCRINTDAPKTESKIARKVITTLVTLVVLFVICWAPVLIDNVLISYHIFPSQGDANSSLRYMRNAFHLLSYFNSCINPIVYGFMSKSFRVGLQKVLYKCCQRRRWESSKPKMNPFTTSKMRTTPVRFTDTRTTEFLPIHPASFLDRNHMRSQKFREVLI